MRANKQTNSSGEVVPTEPPKPDLVLGSEFSLTRLTQEEKNETLFVFVKKQTLDAPYAWHADCNAHHGDGVHGQILLNLPSSTIVDTWQYSKGGRASRARR